MVTDCPAEFNDENVVTKCRKTSHPATFHFDVAVHSRSTNLTYSNWFCAFCNDDVDDLATFRADVSCNNVDIIDDCAFDVTNDILTDDNYIAGQLRYELKFSKRSLK